jgi:hypothetical protein
MILSLDPNAKTLLLSDFTDADIKILAILMADKGVTKIETALANLIRITTEDQRLADRTVIMASIDGLTDAKRKAIVDIITGAVDVSTLKAG